MKQFISIFWLTKKMVVLNHVSIEERPEVANNRKQVADWEADTIIGNNHKGAIVTIDERKTKICFVAPLQQKKAILVENALVSLLKPLREFVTTITLITVKSSPGMSVL